VPVIDAILPASIGGPLDLWKELKNGRKALVIPALFPLIAMAGCSSPAAPPVNPQSSLPEARPASGNPVSKYIKTRK
jgi:hypothetical protein